MNTQLEVVKFNNDFLEVVKVAANNAIGKIDNEYWVSVRKVCENLELHLNTQIKKLKSDSTFEAKLIKVQTRGGMQDMFCIPLEKLNGWLFTINPNKVKPEVKEKLIAYKNECFKVLYNHFINKAISYQTTECVQYSRYKSKISSLAARIGHYKRLYNEARERNAKLMERIRYIESRSVGCNELKSILSKGLKYDELEEKYKKLITEYEVLKTRLDIARQYHLSSLESITELIKKGADIDTKKLPKQ